MIHSTLLSSTTVVSDTGDSGIGPIFKYAKRITIIVIEIITNSDTKTFLIISIVYSSVLYVSFISLTIPSITTIARKNPSASIIPNDNPSDFMFS